MAMVKKARSTEPSAEPRAAKSPRKTKNTASHKQNDSPPATTPRAGKRWDVFISHSSLNKGTATRLVLDLRDLGFRVWVDYEHLFGGDVLSPEIGEAIASSRAFALLWSKEADLSQWVPQELQTALVLRHPILLCLLDDAGYARYPELVGRFYCDFRPSYEQGFDALRAALAQRKAGPRRSKGRNTKRAPLEKLREVYDAQVKIIACVEGNQLETAADLQTRLNPLLEELLAQYPKDPTLLSSAGYHEKNAVLISKANVRRALKKTEVARLDRGARYFHMALAVEPECMSALNGLASVDFMRGNLEMAEHYCLRALAEAHRQGVSYGAAQSDLSLIRKEKARRGLAART